MNSNLIFLKKVNDKSKTIPLNSLDYLGYFRHFPAPTKEWSSSIYAYYNNNDIKSFPVLDKNLVKLIQSFFNFYHKSEGLRSKLLYLRFRRISLRKIFVSKAELKHTNSKVIINIQVYNIQIRLLVWEICQFAENFLFQQSILKSPAKKLKWLKKRYAKVVRMLGPEKTTIKVLILLLKLEYIRYYKFLWDLYVHKFNGLIPKLREVISKIYKKKVEFNIVLLKQMYLNSDILSQAVALKLRVRKNNLWKVIKRCIAMVKRPDTTELIVEAENSQRKGNSIVDKIEKLDSLSFAPLESQVEVSLGKSARLAIAPLLTSTGYSKRLKALFRREDYDSLNQLLFGIMSIPSFISLAKARQIPDKGTSGDKVRDPRLSGLACGFAATAKSIQGLPSIIRGSPLGELPSNRAIWDFFFQSCLRDKAVHGVKLEAKGRLTRRYTASRSVFKFKLTGSLFNLDSTTKKFSAVNLRGHVRSNVQYTLINSKTRNGAFGVKGWVAGI